MIPILTFNKEFIRRVLPWALVLGICGWFTYFLGNEWAFDGYVRSDLKTHSVYVRLFLDSLKSGSLGLESWDSHDGFGQPVFRLYQNLAHFLVAAGCALLGIENTNWATHWMVAFCLVLQPICFYIASRWMNFDQVTSIAAAFVCLLIECIRPLGNDLDAYLVVGLFSQAVAILPFTLTFAYFIRLFVNEVSVKETKHAIRLGAGLALTFLLHHFLGMILVFCFALISILGVCSRWRSPGFVVKVSFWIAAAFAVISSYQLLSIFQDRELAQKAAPFGENWQGFGLVPLLKDWVLGDLLDHKRIPTLSILSLVGACYALRPQAKRAERCILACFLLGFILAAGPETFGNLFHLIPGIQYVHLTRFLNLIHLSAAFLIAIAVGQVVHFIFRFVRGQSKVARPLALVTLASLGAAFFPAIQDKTNFLRTHSARIPLIKESSAAFDTALLRSADKYLERGYLWSAAEYAPRIGGFPIHLPTVSDILGYKQVSNIEQRVNYSTNIIRRIDLSNRSHYRLLNIAAVVTTLDEGKKLPFLKEIYRSENLATFVSDAVGFWDVIGISKVWFTKDEVEYVDDLTIWLQLDTLFSNIYSAIIPERIAKRWPTAVPVLTPDALLGRAGEMVQSQGLKGNKSSSVLMANGKGSYGLFRATFHPRWKILVNQKQVPPKWVAPGFIAFRLEPGRNDCEIEFPGDSFRASLFLLGMATLFGILFPVNRGLLSNPIFHIRSLFARGHQKNVNHFI